MLYPLAMALERVERAKQDSDTTLFFELLYLGEFVLKLTTSAFVAAIEDDRDGHRYRLAHKLVRSDGIGEWSQCLNDALTGPASQFLVSEAKEDRRILTERLAESSWQHLAVSQLLTAAEAFAVKSDINRDKIALQSWFDVFPELRNKTRGHGAPRAAACAASVGPLEHSIGLIVDQNPLFQRTWAYMRQNLSGKYHVVRLTKSGDEFADLARSKRQEGDAIFQEGLYIYYDRPRPVVLVHTDVDLSDFFVPNGAFTG